MDKKSPKSPLPYERYKSGCAWGLLNFCDFHQDHTSNGKLISNRRGLNSHVGDDRCMKNRLDLVPDSREKCQCIDYGVNNKKPVIDSGKSDIIRIREEEMAAEQQTEKNITNTRVQHVISDSQPVSHLPKNRRRKASKAFQIHGCKDIATLAQRQSSCENSVDTSSKKFDAAALTDRSVRSVSCQKQEQHSEINLQVQINEAAEAFINQKFVKGKYLSKDRESNQSKDFLGALEILNSNRDLFIKLLQDPNSLLVKHIEDLRDSQEAGQKTTSFSEVKSSENCRGTARECEEPGYTKKSKGSVDLQPSDRIVVLKPDLTSMQNTASESGCASPQSLYSLRNREQSDKPAYFSFEHMKRKLRRAIRLSGKEKPGITTDCTLNKSPCDSQGLGDGGRGKGREVVGSKSPSKTHLGNNGMENSSLDIKKKEKVGKLKNCEPSIKQQVALNSANDHESSNLSIVSHLKQSESNIYVESRKPFSEVLRNGDEDFSRKRVPTTLGKIISLPEYDFLSAFSPDRHHEHGSIAPQMRFSPYSNYQMVNEKKWGLQKEKKNGYLSPPRQIVESPSWDDKKKHQLQTLDTKSNISDNHFPVTRIHESLCSLNYSSSPRGSVKIVEAYNTTNPTKISPSGVPLQPKDTHDHTGANQTASTANICDENVDLECLKLDSPVEDCTSASSEDVYSPSPLIIKRLEQSDGMKEKAEHPSPVSVLEQFFVEDVTNPLSTISQPAETAVELKQINDKEDYSASAVTSHVDLNIDSTNITDEHDPISEYVRTVLQTSGINWDELSMKCHSPDRLLEPSLFDEVNLLLPNQSCDDRRLLFDYINEILIEVYQCYFSCSPWVVASVKPTMRPAKKMIIYEVMKCVDWHLLSQKPFLTLEQVLEKDLAKSKTWMDTRIDTEDVVSEMIESVLEELMMETATLVHS